MSNNNRVEEKDITINLSQLSSISINTYCRILNEIRDTNINLVKSLKYFLTGILIIFFNKKARLKAVITDKTIDTITVISGFSPNFNNKYDIGRFKPIKNAIINSYFFILPVANAGAIVGPEVESIKLLTRTN